MTEIGWFAEPPRFGFQQRLAVRSELHRERSPYQEIVVLDTENWGRALLLDGALQTTEVDQAAYHEMLVHVPLLAHPRPERVLIIGGGDGGSLRHVLAHPVSRVLQVEIDEAVVRNSQRWLPALSGGAFDDPRAELIIGDGVRHVQETAERFDVILVDSTDPVGPASDLFSVPFYRSVREALRPGGLFVTQCGSPLLMADEWREAIDALRQVFASVDPYLTLVPTYPGVIWSFAAASMNRSPRMPLDDRWRTLLASAATPSYYTPEVHRASFALPASLLADRPLFPALHEAAGVASS